MKRFFFSLLGSLIFGLSPGQSLTKVEYFFNGPDPGIGRAASLNLPSNNGSIDNVNISFPASGLPTGRHVLYFRLLESSGNLWSQTQRMYVDVLQNTSNKLTTMQYFFGEDPGVGLPGNTLVNVTPPDSIVSDYTVNVADVPNGFANGYFRVKEENGNWSQTNRLTLAKTSVANNRVVAMEYTFLSDAGVGSNPLRINFQNPAASAEFDVYVLRTQSQRLDTLLLRVQDTYGLWSQTNTVSRVFANAPVVSLENPVYSSAINLYPNPSKGTITFETDGGSPKNSFEIFNILGTRLTSGQFSGSKHQETFNLPAGVYFLKIANDNGEQLEKVVFE